MQVLLADAEPGVEHVLDAHVEERHAALAGGGAGEQRLAAAGRAVEQHAAAGLAPVALEQVRALEREHDRAVDGLLDRVEPADVLERRRLLLDRGRGRRRALVRVGGEAHRPGVAERDPQLLLQARPSRSARPPCAPPRGSARRAAGGRRRSRRGPRRRLPAGRARRCSSSVSYWSSASSRLVGGREGLRQHEPQRVVVGAQLDRGAQAVQAVAHPSSLWTRLRIGGAIHDQAQSTNQTIRTIKRGGLQAGGAERDQQHPGGDPRLPHAEAGEEARRPPGRVVVRLGLACGLGRARSRSGTRRRRRRAGPRRGRRSRWLKSSTPSIRWPTAEPGSCASSSSPWLARLLVVGAQVGEPQARLEHVAARRGRSPPRRRPGGPPSRADRRASAARRTGTAGRRSRAILSGRRGSPPRPRARLPCCSSAADSTRSRSGSSGASSRPWRASSAERA